MQRIVARTLIALCVAISPVSLLLCGNTRTPADSPNAAQVAAGKIVYADCASCHGANLEGQPNWKSRKPNGRMPAPPHDDTGHTWHHADGVLFGITKIGLVPPYAPAGYQSDMPAFGGKLTDDQIWDVLAYIKSYWSPRMQQAQAEITKRDKE